jgi:type I restriction enzyme M protein
MPMASQQNLRNYLNGIPLVQNKSWNGLLLKVKSKKWMRQISFMLVVKKFAEAGDKFRNVSSIEMGYIFEELIRKFAEASNETAGDHFTPAREVIRLMVNLLFTNQKEIYKASKNPLPSSIPLVARVECCLPLRILLKRKPKCEG